MEPLTKLEAFLIERRNTPFEWGTNDCCLFVADAVKVLTNVDYAASLRGYTTRFGAARRIYKAGGLSSIVDGLLTPINPALARRGDVILCETEEGAALGICVGSKFAAAGPNGVLFYSMTLAKKGWRCPR